MMNFDTLSDVYAAFPTEDSCIQHLEKLLWNNIPISPFDKNSKVYFCKDNKFKCRQTGQYFNVKTQTIFQNSKIGLQKWFAAIWLIMSSENAISSVQLANELGITQKTSWHMMQQIRTQFTLKKKTIRYNNNNNNNNNRNVAVGNSDLEEIAPVIAADKLNMLDWLKMLKK